jgi:5-methyltetrahydrofolate--homocysteine methyltransferase
VNAGEIPIYDDIDKDLLKLCDDILFNKNENSTEELLKYAEKNKGNNEKSVSHEDISWRSENYRSKISHSLVKGIFLKN